MHQFGDFESVCDYPLVNFISIIVVSMYFNQEVIKIVINSRVQALGDVVNL